MPVHAPQRDLQQQQLTTTDYLGIPFLLLLVLFLAGSLVWQYHKHEKQQKEWRRASTNQLDVIRRRNLQLAEDRDSPPRSESPEDNVRTNTHMVGDDVQASKEKKELTKQKDSCSGQRKSAGKINQMAGSSPQNRAEGESKNHPNCEASKSLPSDRISQIRVMQQEKLVLNTKTTQRQRNRQQKKKKETLHHSLNHRAADEAYQRRRDVIAEEASYILRSRPVAQVHTEQPLPNESEELERIAVQMQQNIEYQESLQRDQELARQLLLENDRKLRRAKALADANQRLVTIGVQSNTMTIQGNNVSRTSDEKGEIKVRLLLPSGHRVEGTFLAQHTISDVYDLALIALDEKNLLWDQENEGHDNYMIYDSSVDNLCGSTSSDGNNNPNILKEWKHIFFPFTIVSTFPRRTFDDLSITLEDCGLNQSAMLMVVVESD
mmetsp:Transcript_24908/g.59973  ORF Transcript_24908/g.59973 Transcript_24908/m.59973 type:complete len:435 (-) Transcript_24908:3-1307(-)